MKKEFFYLINYNSERDVELCNLEMKYIFGYIPKYRHILSNIDTNPSRSPFIKEKISILFSGNSIEEIAEEIKNNNLSFDRFKVFYLKSGDCDVIYAERLKALRKIGMSINGEADIHNPLVTLGISKIGDTWIFGIHEKNDFKWHCHDKRPFSYSNALTLKAAKSLVNIAVGNDYTLKVVDPCCGVGTVLVEALDLGIDIKGYEINPLIAEHAVSNLKYFGFPNVVTNEDMTLVTEKFDVVILDMPYGLFTATSEKTQKSLIEKASTMGKRLILVETHEFDEFLKTLGYNIVDKCTIYKNNFKRHILVCEMN